MYVSADEVQPGSSGDNTYAMPIKKQQKNDVYAIVNKKPKADESGKFAHLKKRYRNICLQV